MNTGGVESIIEYYNSPESLMDSSLTLASTIAIAEAIAGIFLLLSLAYMFVDNWIKIGERGSFFNSAEIKRVMVIAILIPVIPALLTFIMGIGNITADAMAMDPGDKMKAIEKLWDKVNEGPEEDFSLLFLTMSIVYRLMALLVMIISIIFMYIIKFVILLFSGVFIQYCILISPLAMAFSILPIFKDQVTKLLQVFFNACFVGLTLNILDHLLFESLFLKIISSLNDPAADIFNYMMIASTCFTCCLFYLLAFWLTSKYVGNPGAAFIMSTALTATTMAVMAAGKIAGAVASGGKTAVAGGSSPIGNVVKSGAKSIKNE